jgi:hypothetical protein
MPISKSELRKRAHTGKKKFPTQAAADAAVLRYERGGLHGLESYKCPFGNHWHAGHKKKSKKPTSTEGLSSRPPGEVTILGPCEHEEDPAQ